MISQEIFGSLIKKSSVYQCVLAGVYYPLRFIAQARSPSSWLQRESPRTIARSWVYPPVHV